MAKLYANGTVEISVSATHKLAIQSDDSCKVYQKVGYPNYPDSWNLLATTTAGTQYLSAAFSSATTVRIDAGASDAIYATGTAPVSDEFAFIDGVTAGTAAAGKAVVLDANKDVGDLRNLDVTNLDAGASGTAGSIDVFPATASRGKLTLACTDQSGDTAVTINANAMGQATTVNIPDPGAAASYVAQSTAALTLAEVDVLDGATAGTQVASKAVVADANINTGVSKVTELHIGASGSEVQVVATPAEINSACDISARIVALDATSLAVTQAAHAGKIIRLDHTAAASTVTLPASAGTGAIYTFIVGAVNTNNHVIQVANATDEFAGTLFQTDTDTGDALISMPCLAADNFDTITLNGTTSGGLVGDIIQIVDIATGVWQISGHTNASGAVASPFSAAV